ncbi:hypothetical protein XM38_029120 [Halomicronema hongdechloris C2206]|uniref:Uncharacterized protein n=1 Tax=Halomicronema hongdechloris C2206 TaxID=1641165 RepID=A0A1Z3HNT2_9CYAN|nr:hypothetical protein XM38_029120 [Halomicronema hongdechloris C2206]
MIHLTFLQQTPNPRWTIISARLLVLDGACAEADFGINVS